MLLSYNCQHLLKDFLPKVIATTPNSSDYKIIVVDNASTDGTDEFLKSEFPQIDTVTIPVNKGFTNGYAESLARIDAQYYCLLSSDVEVSENWLEPVISLFDQDEKVAVIQPKIRSFFERPSFEYAGACGGYIDTLGYPFCRGRIFFDVEEDKGQYQSVEEIFWASGACFFIRANIYHELGGLDDDFYAHMEEIDLCWRIKNRGHKILVCPDSEVFHMGGAVITYGSPAKIFRNHRNNLIMLVKNLPGQELLWKLPVRFLLDYLAMGKALVGRDPKGAWAIVRAHFSFLSGWGKWRRKRKAEKQWVTQRNRKGIYPKSIIAAYFLKGRRRFDQLGWKP